MLTENGKKIMKRRGNGCWKDKTTDMCTVEQGLLDTQGLLCISWQLTQPGDIPEARKTNKEKKQTQSLISWCKTPTEYVGVSHVLSTMLGDLELSLKVTYYETPVIRDMLCSGETKNNSKKQWMRYTDWNIKCSSYISALGSERARESLWPDQWGQGPQQRVPGERMMC